MKAKHRKEYDPEKFNLELIKKAMANLFYGKDELTPEEEQAPLPPLWADGEDEDDFGFSASPKTDDEIDEIIANPRSGYHKIKPGFFYKIGLETAIHTGQGGAQMMYRTLLKDGLTEEEIEQIIFVHIDGNEIPLSQITWYDGGQ